MQVFRHPLAVGDVIHIDLVAHGHVEHRREGHGFVHLGEDHAGEVVAAVGIDHVVEGVAAAGGVEQQQARHLAGAGEHGGLLGDHLVALAHAHGVDQHHVLVAQAGEGFAQVGGVAHHIHRHAEDAAVDAQCSWAPIR